MTALELVGFGAMNMDCLCQVDEIVVDGEQLVTDIMSLPGGSAANTVYALAKLGIKAGFVGAVGGDEDGKKLLKDLRSVSVDTTQIRVKQKTKTGSTICLSDKLGRRAIYVSPGANSLLVPEDVQLTYLNQARLVHLSSFVDDEQFNLQVSVIKQLKDSVKVSLAPGMFYAAKGLKGLAPLLEKTHIVFLNRHEIIRLTGKDFDSGAKDCLKLGCHIVVVTLGEGLSTDQARTVTAHIYEAGKKWEIDSEAQGGDYKLETTGAGDAFAAGFLFGFLKEKALLKCGLLGDIMACFAIRAPGARKGLPTLAQLSQSYSERCGEQL